MLLNLHIKNFALIDEIDIDFTEGLNILTGETGAGKSIILGSLNIALGAKADKDFIRTGEEYALVEITFKSDKEEFLKTLDENDISYEDDIVCIQRKILPQRSVFKINSQTVSASCVKEIADALIDVYGQHDYQNLLNSRKHIEILDDYSADGLKDCISEYKDTYTEYIKLKSLTESPKTDEVKREREISLLEYQINEIEAAALKKDEEEEVENKLRILENSSKIRDALSSVQGLIFDSEGCASSLTDMALRDLSSVSSFDSKLEDLFEELNNVSSSLSDIEREMGRLIEEFAPDDEELDRIRERYDLINELERKYGRTLEDVLKYLDEKKNELDEMTAYESKREEILRDYEKIKEKLAKVSSKLSEKRKEYAVKFEKEIIEGLSDLNFNQSKFKVNITELDDHTSNGKDKVNFEISLNPGEPYKPLENVSSGGELSRIMLALKTSVADRDNTETLIFDEIDAGISGVTAWKVAKKLALLSLNHQIICITHLQQIASMSDIHFEIKKEVSEDKRTNTYINKLDKDGEIKEIARMLGDENGSDKFIQNALEIKKQALDYKKQISR